MDDSLRSPARHEALLVLRYGVVGLANTAVGFGGILFCMLVLALPPALSNVLGSAVSYVLGYLLHRRFTFRSSVAHRRGLPSWLLVTAIGFGANLAVLAKLIALGVDPVLAQAVAVATYITVTFLLSRFFVFADGGR